MAIVFEFSLVLGALTLGFVLGRIWEMRREMQRDLGGANRNLALAISIARHSIHSIEAFNRSF
jgi:hypothetical protein